MTSARGVSGKKPTSSLYSTKRYDYGGWSQKWSLINWPLTCEGAMWSAWDCHSGERHASCEEWWGTRAQFPEDPHREWGVCLELLSRSAHTWTSPQSPVHPVTLANLVWSCLRRYLIELKRNLDFYSEDESPPPAGELRTPSSHTGLQNPPLQRAWDKR